MGFSRPEHWSGLPCPSPGDLPHPGKALSEHCELQSTGSQRVGDDLVTTTRKMFLAKTANTRPEVRRALTNRPEGWSLLQGVLLQVNRLLWCGTFQSLPYGHVSEGNSIWATQSCVFRDFPLRGSSSEQSFQGKLLGETASQGNATSERQPGKQPLCSALQAQSVDGCSLPSAQHTVPVPTKSAEETEATKRGCSIQDTDLPGQRLRVGVRMRRRKGGK